jgi:hypothetical protein
MRERGSFLFKNKKEAQRRKEDEEVQETNREYKAKV